MSDPPLSARAELLAWLSLLALTALTLALAAVEMGVASLAAALLIAGAKSTVVAVVFMHVHRGRRLIAIFAVGSILWLAILVVLVLADVLARGWLPVAAE